MGCKYVKDFKFDSSAGYTGSAGKQQIKTYMRGGSVQKAPLDAAKPRQTPVDMRPLRTANAKTAMKEATQKRVSGASGKIKTAGQYAKGGAAKKTGKYADGGTMQSIAPAGTQLTPAIGNPPPQTTAQFSAAPTQSPQGQRMGMQMPQGPQGQRMGMPTAQNQNLFEMQAQRNAQQPQQRMSPLQMQQIQSQQQQAFNSPQMQQMRQMQERVQNSPEMRMMQNLNQSIGAAGGRPSQQQLQQMQMLQQRLQNSPMMAKMQGLQQSMNQPMNRATPQRAPMTKSRANYNEGGMACKSGCNVEMKKGGKTKAADKKSAPKKSAKRSEKAEDKMIEQVLNQMLSQAGQTGRMPGVPELGMQTQGMPMPAPNARAVPVASQSPMLAMRNGGMSRKTYC